ncbi:MAG: TatD family hydrolase, partial [Bacteroidales bacterium]|nr:TatD family hydrolase [Bacteroidales bacterium]
MLIDTHSHIYLEEFDSDREEVVSRAKSSGLQGIVLPNVDSTTVTRLLELANSDKSFFYAANGLHPTSVKDDYKEQLEQLLSDESMSRFQNLVAIGEIGLDLYWDDTYINYQIEAFACQLSYASERNLPVIIHC